MTEIWRTTTGFPNYEVSSVGRVRSKRGLLSPFRHNQYTLVNLFRGRAFVQCKVHVLVLETFVGPRPEGYQAHHKNGNKHDNRVENLEWLSAKDHGRTHRKFNYAEIKELYETGNHTQRGLAEKYGVSVALINRIVNGR